MTEPVTPKPTLRGVLHQYAAAAAVGAGLVLVAVAPGGRATIAVAVFAASLVLQFAVSATLHRGHWTGRTRAWLRRLDHAAIFVLIAGTYTPFVLVGLPAERGWWLLGAIWAGAGIGVLYCLAYLRAAKRWRSGLALALGWSIAPYIPDVRAAYGDGIFGFLLAGGCLYTVGAVVYATERPTLWPSTFGFHEAFHLLTVAAASLHFAGVLAIVS
ncbi:MAG: hemolysin III family protein [Myxococcota bacterium]